MSVDLDDKRTRSQHDGSHAVYIGTTHDDDDRDDYLRKAPLLIITYVNALYIGLLVCLYLSISIDSLGSTDSASVVIW